MNRCDLIIVAATTVAMSFFGPAVADELRVPSDFSTIQAAIDASTDGDEVVIADGVYTGVGNKDLDFTGKAIVVRSENGPENCVIDSEGSGRAFTFHSAETPASVVQGLHITNGELSRQYDNRNGGGVLIESSSPTFLDCRFSQNLGILDGGGIYVLSGSPHVERCTFDQNQADGDGAGGGAGGGLYSSGTPTILDCTFTRNIALDRGGAIYSTGDTIVIERCTFDGNFVRNRGGAVNVRNGIVEDCSFVGNRGADGGAAIFHSSRIGCAAVHIRSKSYRPSRRSDVSVPGYERDFALPVRDLQCECGRRDQRIPRFEHG